MRSVSLPRIGHVHAQCRGYHLYGLCMWPYRYYFVKNLAHSQTICDIIWYI